MIKHTSIILLILGFVTASLIAADPEFLLLGPERGIVGRHKSLFDGKTFTGWETKSGDPVGIGWVIEDGSIHRNAKGGDIFTVDEYENFELDFEWKIASGTNSGVKYRVKKFGEKLLGPEYQVLDDVKHKNGKKPLTTAASLYELYASSASKLLKPVGEYNYSKIIARGNHIEHWINGKKVVIAEVESAKWKKRKAASKFKANEGFGSGAGKIMLQDHGHKVWFRNISIIIAD